MTDDLAAISPLFNYDTAVDWTARLEREGPFLVSALRGAPSERVLDLGSGTGEHANWLAERGFTVVGIEGVKERWEVAKSRAVANVQHLAGDLGAVEAMVRGHFGAVVCLGNTLPALIGVETISRMFVGLRRRLLPGGVFVGQQLNYDALAPGELTRLPQRRLAVEGGELVFERQLELRAEGVVAVTETVHRRQSGGEGGGELVHQRQLFQQGWRHQELLTLLDVAGFRRVEVFGGFASQPFDLAASAEMVLLAT
ncbi:MAG: class I SAM-dependent methyltransferase [Acidobacteriota bacterium]